MLRQLLEELSQTEFWCLMILLMNQLAALKSIEKQPVTKYVCLYLWLKLNPEKHLSNHKRSLFFFFLNTPKILSCSNWEVSLVYLNEIIKKRYKNIKKKTLLKGMCCKVFTIMHNFIASKLCQHTIATYSLTCSLMDNKTSDLPLACNSF